MDINISLVGEGEVKLSIHNYGSGIPLEYRGKIFSKFSQADSSDARHIGGTGLGLNISKAIIENMRGCIEFNSVPGQDATFFLRLPILIENSIQSGDQERKLAI